MAPCRRGCSMNHRSPTSPRKDPTASFPRNRLRNRLRSSRAFALAPWDDARVAQKAALTTPSRSPAVRLFAASRPSEAENPPATGPGDQRPSRLDRAPVPNCRRGQVGADALDAPSPALRSTAHRLLQRSKRPGGQPDRGRPGATEPWARPSATKSTQRAPRP